MGRDHGEAEVERIVQQCLERFGLSETDLESLPGSDPRKVSIARFLHQSTTTPKALDGGAPADEKRSQCQSVS
jgi:hypothetical protein